jgi:hypothetical protein
MNVSADLLASMEKVDVFSVSLEGEQVRKYKNALSP